MPFLKIGFKIEGEFKMLKKVKKFEKVYGKQLMKIT